MKFLVTLILISMSAACFSQTPGYMGKRFVAGYGIYASPGFIGSDGRTPVNIIHEGFIEFAAAKKFSLGFSARFYNAVSPNLNSAQATAFTNGSSYSLDDTPNGFTTVKGRNYMVYGKFFKGNYLAPWGKYFIVGATLNTFTSSYDPDQMYIQYGTNNSSYYDYSYSYYSDFGPTKQSYKKFDLMIGNGRSRIIANRIIIDYGYNINVWGATSLLLSVLDSDTRYSADEYVKKTGSIRVRSVNRFNVFCKIGVLLF